MTTRRGFVAGAAGLAAAVAANRPTQAWAAAAPPSLAELYAPDYTADTALSPNGERIAVLHNQVRAKGVTESWIEIVEISNPTAEPKRVGLGSAEASSVAWANDNRLLVWIVYDVTQRGMPTEKIVRVIALQDDGTKPAALFGDRGKALQYIHDLGSVVDNLPDDPDHVMMMAWEALRGLPALYKVDVNTGASVILEYGQLRTGGWITKEGAPIIRFDGDRRGATLRIMARMGGGGDYNLVKSINLGQLREFDLYTLTEKPGVFLGAARGEGEDKMTVREVDLAGLQIGPPLYGSAKVDIDGIWQDSRGKLLAATWVEDRRAYDFVDKGFAPHFAAIERHFGPEVSIRLTDISDTRKHVLGVAAGPRQPGLFFCYDRDSHAIVELGARAPWLTTERLGKTHLIDVKTRDGAAIRAYLTAPASGAPGPLIVMPHGGPELRDYNDFDLWSQAFAAKGWWVLRPNFRGSGGYGHALASAGWRRWHDRMQEDLEDATAQVIATHQLDASRVAIVGGSYGGYAALMGAVRRPELYKAVVSIAGVSDLAEMLKWEAGEDDTPDKFHYAFWRARIGDPKVDAEALAKGSPRLRAAEVKAPVLLIHGVWDETVPLEQSRMMAKALEKAGKSVELVEIKRAGHSPATMAADQDQLVRTMTFVEKALG